MCSCDVVLPRPGQRGGSEDRRVIDAFDAVEIEASAYATVAA
jgi:hypothetical protein